MIRIQLALPNNHFVSPQTFNRFFTMHGTTMVFFVGIPILFGFGNYLVPLMIGARDMAFPRLNAFSFWVSAFGGLLLYFSYLGGDGLYGAGTAPDVGWFAYAPLTARVFSPGHSSDYWTLGVLLSGVGTVGTALNIMTTAICMRCPGMKLSRMPLFVWLMMVTSFLGLVALGPLTAAQIMLLLDRYLGSHFFDTQAGGSAVLWMHFFWIFGHPGSLYPGAAGFRLRQRDYSGLLAQGHLWLSRHGRGIGGHRLYQHYRLGSPHVRDWHGA